MLYRAQFRIDGERDMEGHQDTVSPNRTTSTSRPSRSLCQGSSRKLSMTHTVSPPANSPLFSAMVSSPESDVPVTTSRSFSSLPLGQGFLPVNFPLLGCQFENYQSPADVPSTETTSNSVPDPISRKPLGFLIRSVQGVEQQSQADATEHDDPYYSSSFSRVPLSQNLTRITGDCHTKSKSSSMETSNSEDISTLISSSSSFFNGSQTQQASSFVGHSPAFQDANTIDTRLNPLRRAYHFSVIHSASPTDAATGNEDSTAARRRFDAPFLSLPHESKVASNPGIHPFDLRKLAELGNEEINPPAHGPFCSQQRPVSSYSVIETMWEADQAPMTYQEIEVDSISDGDENDEPYQEPLKEPYPAIIGASKSLHEANLVTKRSSRIVTPRLKGETNEYFQELLEQVPSSTSPEVVATPAPRSSEAPQDHLQQTHRHSSALETIEVPMRTVSQDYPIPRWMVRKKVFMDGYRYPYRYAGTFLGGHGIVNYDIEGDSQNSILLCFHGLNATRSTFQEFQDILSKYEHCVITFDLYGHGLSGSPKYRNSYSPCFCRYGKEPATYSLEFFIQQAEELLEHLGLSHRHLSLCGFSMGGVIAAGFARKHSEKIDRLILISSAGMLAKRPPAPVKLLKCCSCCIPCVPKCICRCCCNRQHFMKKFRREEIENGVAEAVWSRLMWQLFVKKGVVEAFLGCVANIPMWSAEKIFKSVGESNLPVLILWGKQDRVAPITAAPVRGSHLAQSIVPQAAVALLLTFLEFPRHCDMKEWRYLLPFSPKGVYVPRENRCPDDFTAKSFLQHLEFKPRLLVKLPRSPK